MNVIIIIKKIKMIFNNKKIVRIYSNNRNNDNDGNNKFNYSNNKITTIIK